MNIDKIYLLVSFFDRKTSLKFDYLYFMCAENCKEICLQNVKKNIKFIIQPSRTATHVYLK